MAIYNTNISGGLNTKDCTADASKILDGYTAGVGKEIVTGTMANNGDVNSAIVNGVLQKGYTSGGTIANLEEGNIKSGVNIAGKIGSLVGVATGSIKPSSTDYKIKITHNLGRTPTFFCMATGSVTDYYEIQSVLYSNVNNYEKVVFTAQTVSQRGEVIVTDTTIELTHNNDNYNFYKGYTYKSIAY